MNDQEAFAYVKRVLREWGEEAAKEAIKETYAPAYYAAVAVKIGLRVDAWTQSTPRDVKRWNDYRRHAESVADRSPGAHRFGG